MRKKIYSLLLLLSVSTILFAQKTIPEFGKIDIADLKMKTCQFEPDANAMKLFDVQEAEYEPSPFGGKIRTQKRVRIKIFNEKGYGSATIRIPYYSNKKNSKISDLKGIVYSLNDSGNIAIQKVEEADFFKDKAVDKVDVLRFTFPNLKPGSVIEYTYTLVEKNRLQFDTWYVQGDIPTGYISNKLIIPSYAEIKEAIFGNDTVAQKKETVTKGIDKEIKIFYRENIASFRPEPLMSSYNDNILRMSYVLLPTAGDLFDNYTAASLWKLTANMLLKSPLYDDFFKKEIPGTQKIIDTASTILNVDERIGYLYHAVKKRIPDKMEQSFFPSDIADAWKTRNGSSAEINMILMNLLTRSKITCYPVLVSTRNNGKINLDFPSFGQFNGMDILVVDKGFSYLMDASLKYQSYDVPPLNILNRQAFLLNPDNIQWVTITDDRPLLKQSTDIFGVLTAEGIFEGSATIKYHDYAKSLALDSSAEDNEGKFSDKKNMGIKLLSDKKENLENDDPLVQTIEFDYEPQQTNEFYFINPQLLSTKKINPFSQEKRITDIDFGCNQELHLSMQLEIPANFEVDNLPKNIVIRSPDSSFAFTRIVTADRSNISYSQVLEIKKAVFEKDKYASLYDFFSRVAALMTEEIVVKKKK